MLSTTGKRSNASTLIAKPIYTIFNIFLLLNALFSTSYASSSSLLASISSSTTTISNETEHFTTNDTMNNIIPNVGLSNIARIT
jgi:hypothetical protein